MGKFRSKLFAYGTMVTIGRIRVVYLLFNGFTVHVFNILPINDKKYWVDNNFINLTIGADIIKRNR